MAKTKKKRVLSEEELRELHEDPIGVLTDPNVSWLGLLVLLQNTVEERERKAREGKS